MDTAYEIVEKNEWENLTYWCNGVQLGPDLVEGLFQWPNGSRSEHKVIWLKRSRDCHDHGHTYQVESYIPGVEVSTYGITHFVELNLLSLVIL